MIREDAGGTRTRGTGLWLGHSGSSVRGVSRSATVLCEPTPFSRRTDISDLGPARYPAFCPLACDAATSDACERQRRIARHRTVPSVIRRARDIRRASDIARGRVDRRRASASPRWRVNRPAPSDNVRTRDNRRRRLSDARALADASVRHRARVRWPTCPSVSPRGRVNRLAPVG